VERTNATRRVNERSQNAFFNTPNTRQYTEYLAFHFKPQIINVFATEDTISTAVTCSRPAPSRTLVCSGSINASPAQASQWPKSNISFREFCTHALPASPKHAPTITSLHPLHRHHRRCIAFAPSASRHCLQSRIHEVVLPASASRAYHLQPRLSNDRRRHALAPGAFI
jgi:hypothetical protein